MKVKRFEETSMILLNGSVSQENVFFFPCLKVVKTQTGPLWEKHKKVINVTYVLCLEDNA